MRVLFSITLLICFVICSVPPKAFEISKSGSKTEEDSIKASETLNSGSETEEDSIMASETLNSGSDTEEDSIEAPAPLSLLEPGSQQAFSSRERNIKILDSSTSASNNQTDIFEVLDDNLAGPTARYAGNGFLLSEKNSFVLKTVEEKLSKSNIYLNKRNDPKFSINDASELKNNMEGYLNVLEDLFTFIEGRKRHFYIVFDLVCDSLAKLDPSFQCDDPWESILKKCSDNRIALKNLINHRSLIERSRRLDFLEEKLDSFRIRAHNSFVNDYILSEGECKDALILIKGF